MILDSHRTYTRYEQNLILVSVWHQPHLHVLGHLYLLLRIKCVVKSISLRLYQLSYNQDHMFIHVYLNSTLIAKITFLMKLYYSSKLCNFTEIHQSPWTASVACRHGLWMVRLLFLTFNLTSDDLWPWYMTFDCMNIWRFPYHINKPSLVPIGHQLFKWGHFHIFSPSYNLTSDDLWPWYMTFDYMNIWRFPYHINKPSLVPIGHQLFKWGHFHIFSLSYNLTSDDLWPWYVTFDLMNKWGFPCCIYDPTLVEIHQSMWKLEPNVNPFSQHQITKTDNSLQSDPYLSCWGRWHKKFAWSCSKTM